MSYWIKFQERSFNKQYTIAKQESTINQNILFNFASLATISEKKDVLICDVGGGTGANIALLKRIFKRHFNVHVKTSIVCDVSIVGLTRAVSLGLEAIRCSVTHLPFRDKIFNIVLSVHVIEHVVNDRRAIYETGRVTKKGGLLYVGTPNKATNLYIPFVLDYHVFGRNPLHIRSGYDAYELTIEFNKLGFKRIFWRFHGFWGAFCAHNIGRIFGLIYFLFEHILRLRMTIIPNNIKHVQDKFFSFDETFGNNPHGMNFYMFLEKIKQ